MTWRRVPKHLTRVYEKGILLHYESVYPLILDHEFDSNWLDYEAMFERYGEFATYREHYLEHYMWGPKTVIDYAGASYEDYSPTDRRQKVIDDLERRRRGEMLYQRG